MEVHFVEVYSPVWGAGRILSPPQQPTEGTAMQNKDAVRQAYDYFNQAKLAEAAELFAPDAVWHFPGNNAISGEYRGRDAIVHEFLPKFPALSGATFRSTLVDVADGDEYTFVLQRSQAQRGGQSIDYLVCHQFTFRDGLVSEVSTYPYDQKAQDAFWQ